jgi:hypothetical protein
MESELTFLFYHYGKIPTYLEYAIEHVRIFNPDSEILLVTEGIKNTSMLDRFSVKIIQSEKLGSDELDKFKKNYKHISCFNEKYERFVLERWFLTEIIRKQRPERTYVMLDSDIALFGNLDDIVKEISRYPIVLTNRNPGFNLITGDISDYLYFIIDYYCDDLKISQARKKFTSQNNQEKLFTLGEMQLLFEYLDLEKGMKIHNIDSSFGFVDGNIHLPQGFDYLQLRRRPRKKVFWRVEEGRTIPYFNRGDRFVKALILHFQGPGKRVFKRFNSLDGPPTLLQIWWWNQIFQKRWLANLM